MLMVSRLSLGCSFFGFFLIGALAVFFDFIDGPIMSLGLSLVFVISLIM